MTLWLRARRGKAITVTLVLFVAALLGARDVSLSMPAIAATYGLTVPVVLLAPLALSSVLGWGLMSGDQQLERISSRPIAGMDVALATAVALLACSLALITATATGSSAVAAAGRNALAYVGLMLFGRRLLGNRAGTLLPAAVAVVAAVLGADASGQARRWTLVLRPSDDPVSWVAACVCLGLGVAATVAAPRLFGWTWPGQDRTD